MSRRKNSRRPFTIVLLLAAIAALPVRVDAAAPAVPTIAVNPTTLTPFNSGGCYSVYPCFKISGQTDPGVKVTVIASDAFGGSSTVSTYSAERTDPGTGVAAGDYSIAPNVTGLGTHTTTPSVISFVAYAEDSVGTKSGQSPPVTATKYATTNGDTNPPTVTIASQRPPAMACSTGYCHFSLCLFFSITGTRGACSGRYTMTGLAEDLNETAYGLASEIADVVFTVKDSADTVVWTQHGVGTRRGTQGFWAVSIVIADYTVGETYSWSLVGIDAAGNSSAPITGSFTRFPA